MTISFQSHFINLVFFFILWNSDTPLNEFKYWKYIPEIKGKPDRTLKTFKFFVVAKNGIESDEINEKRLYKNWNEMNFKKG